MSFVIARQPIYDRERNVFAYEIYLRRKDSPESYPSEVPFSKAAYIVTDIISEMGFDKVGKGKKIVINVSLESILNKALDILPFDRVIFDLNKPEVPVGETVYRKVLDRILDLKGKGAMFILNEKLYRSSYRDLVRLSDIIEFIFPSATPEKAHTVKNYGKKLLISRIEKEDEYRKALEMGADYLEGNYLSPPEVIKDFELAPFLKITLLRLMSMMSAAKSLKDFAQIISSDVGMTVRFLQFVNSAYFARRKKIEDVTHAVAYIGLENLKRFILLLALNEYVKIENPELWKKSLIRAEIAQELTERYSPDLAHKAFLAGLFSLLDRILGVDVVEFLNELNIDEEIIEAFKGGKNRIREVLDRAIFLEEALSKGDEELEKVAEKLSEEMGIPAIELVIIAKEAARRAEEVLKI